MMQAEQLGQIAEPTGGLDLGQVLKRRKLLLLLGLAVGSGLAYLYFLRQPPVYESTAQVLITQKKGNNLPFEGADLVSSSSLANEILQLRSDELLRNAISNGELEKLPTFRSGAGALTAGLRIRQIKGTDVLEISFQGGRAQDCRSGVMAITNSYVKFVDDSKNESNDDIKTIINRAVNSVQVDLNHAETELEEFHRTTELMLSGVNAINIHAERTADLQKQINGREFQETQINAQINTIEAAQREGGDPLALQMLVELESGNRIQRVQNDGTLVRTPQGPTSPPSTPWTNQLLQLSVQLQSAQDRYGAKHPRVIELVQQKRMIEGFIAKDRLNQSTQIESPEPQEAEPLDYVQAYLGRLRMQLNTLRAEKKSLLEKMGNERSKAKIASEDVIKNDNIKKKVDRLRELNTELLQRLKDVSFVQSYEGREASIIVPASVAAQVGPDFAKIMSIGSVLGLLAGLGLACLIELADKSFRGPDDLMAELGIPVLSHIPFMRDAKKRKGAGNDVGNALITVLRPKSRTAEAYRSVRTALYFSTSGEVNKIVQVTSPVAGDGKSTLAGNLAVAIAHSGKRVLLVDADLRRPTVHKVFGLSNKLGVSTVVSGSSTLQDATHDTQVENLSVLTCGPRPDNPSEMLLSPEFEQLLEFVRSAFDFVVIDSPPILAVTDPASVAARADGVIITLRLAKRSRDLARRAVDQLQNVGANILGVVVNGVDSVESYGYRSYSYGGYGYGGYGQGYGGYYANQSGYYDEGARQPNGPKKAVNAETKS